jgi:integrase
MRKGIERHVRGQPVDISLSDFSALFLGAYPRSRKIRASSLSVIRYLLGNLILPEIGDVPLGAVDGEIVARMISRLRGYTRSSGPPEGPLAEATIVVALSVARRLAAYCYFHEVIDPLAPAVERFLEAKRARLTAGSFYRYESMLRGHVIPNLPPETVPARMAEADLLALAEKLRSWTREVGRTSDLPRPRLSMRTIRQAVGLVRTILGYAEETHYIPRAPKIHAPRVAETPRPRPYSKEESRQLIGAATCDEDRALFLVALDLGIRKSETLGLEWSQVDFKNHAVTVDRQIHKGDRRPTKPGRSRVVPMSGVVEAALRKIRHLRGPLVFCHGDGRPLADHDVRRIFEGAQRAADIRRVRWHDLRHVFATRLTDDGMSPLELQALLGHASARSTQTYVHPSTNTLPSVLDPDPAS